MRDAKQVANQIKEPGNVWELERYVLCREKRKNQGSSGFRNVNATKKTFSGVLSNSDVSIVYS